MLSRVANSLFWLGRYLERADSAARLLAVTHSYAQELRSVSHTAADECWAVALHLLGVDDVSPEDASGIFWRLAFDRELDLSLLSGIALARENARGIRD